MTAGRARAIVTWTLLAAACGGAERSGSGMVKDDRLDGEWELTLTVMPTALALETHEGPTEAHGTVAFVANHAGAPVPGFGTTPEQVGTHNLPLGLVVPGLDRAGTPTAAGTSTGDSVRLMLDSQSDEPVVLRGVWQGAGASGEWTAHRRADIDRGGRFTLRRADR